MKLDLSKACDRSNYLYLRVILIHMGFYVQMVNWMMGCSSYVSFAMLINGLASRFLRPSRGLSQICLLAPLVLLCIVEG